MLKLILIVNAIWFGMGFYTFAVKGTIFAKSLVPRSDRSNKVFPMLIASGKFVGGFNLALCTLNVLMIIFTGAFDDSIERVILFSVFALAHGTQFLGNVPIALANRKGGGAWPVKGTMLFIFITDFVMMIANLIVTWMSY